MKVYIKNIGAIAEANIELEGITIIAGENNSGKSTVGKVLFALLNNMFDWPKAYISITEKYYKDFLYSNSIQLEDWCMKESGAKRRRTNKADQLQNNFSKNTNFAMAIEDYQTQNDRVSRKNLEEVLFEYCVEYIGLYIKCPHHEIIEKYHDYISEVVDVMLVDSIHIRSDELMMQLDSVWKSFEQVFNRQYRKIGTERSDIRFTDNSGREINISMTKDSLSLDAPIRSEKRVFVIESPKIFDLLSDTKYGHVQKEYLQYLMAPNSFRNRNEFRSRGDDMLQPGTSDEMKEITDEIERLINGRADFYQKTGLEFKDSRLSEPIHASNVSTGLKAMALLEYAIRIKAINKGDILILDEPEINLHPEWQVHYAKAIVILQKKYDLQILVTTHSPYFLRAIECYTSKYDIMDKLNVYRVKKKSLNDIDVYMENISYSEYGITELYEDMSAPMDKLNGLIDSED